MCPILSRGRICQSRHGADKGREITDHTDTDMPAHHLTRDELG